MALFLVPRDIAGPREVPIGQALRIGSAETDNLRLPAASDVGPQHAVVVRSSVYQVPVLVDLAAHRRAVLVNGRRIATLKVLRHRDRVRIGNVDLRFLEIVVRDTDTSPTLIGSRCLVCKAHIVAGHSVVACPRCRGPHHVACWFMLQVCAYATCGYPVSRRTRAALAGEVVFEPLEEGSALLKERRTCAAGLPRDQIPFQEGSTVAHCPKCKTPFHIECWLSLRACKKCNHDIAALLRSVFVPPEEAA